MQAINNTFKAKDNIPVFYFHWPVETSTPLRAVIQIAHGIGEHAGRFDTFAKTLNDQGFAVYANDHRAHGRTAGTVDQLGKCQGSDFWDDTVEDMHELTLRIKADYPNQKIFLLGHSMGSLLSRDYITKYGDLLSGIILSGTASFIPGLGHIILFLGRGLILLKGVSQQSTLLKPLFFEHFNRQFRPNRTKLDWISRDEKKVDEFEADPLRIEDFQLGVFVGVAKGSKKVNEKVCFEKTPKDLPMFIFSGDKDPVGEMGKGVTKVFNAFNKAGVKDITYKLYEGGRHEMLNETNWEEVYGDIFLWLDEKVGNNEQ